MEDNAIEVKNATKIFKLNYSKGISRLIKNGNNNKQFLNALDGISFNVKKGEVLGIIGLNGSGKTTLLRVIAGIYKPDQGSIKVNGTISPLMQLGAGFQGELNATENVIMNGLLLGLRKSSILGKVDSIIDYAGLQKFSNLKLKHFSAGMRARLAFSTAIQIEPDILLVDEILSVGDIGFRKKSYESFLSFKKNNKTILHASHDLGKLAEFSDKILMMENGHKVMLGEPTEVIKKYQATKNNKQ